MVRVCEDDKGGSPKIPLQFLLFAHTSHVRLIAVLEA